jgi:hypothetical protein
MKIIVDKSAFHWLSEILESCKNKTLHESFESIQNNSEITSIEFIDVK